MSAWDDIAAHLRHYTLEEAIGLIGAFLAELDNEQQARFLELVTRDPRPLPAGAMGLGDGQDLHHRIQALHDDIANDVYVEYGVGFDPKYGDYRGVGDDSWIDEIDNLFATADRFFRAGQFHVAAKAYVALFAILNLAEDGFHFTRPNPAEALQTDIDEAKERLFVAIGRSEPEPAAAAIAIAANVSWFGSRRYALLDAWAGRLELMAALEAALVEQASQPLPQGPHDYIHPHASDLLREFYRRYRTRSDYEDLCRQTGPQQGWPYEDLVALEREHESWERVLAWAEDGLAKLPVESRYRPALDEARGQAMLQLGRTAEAVETLLALFQQQRTASVYLMLRDAARTVGRWEALHPQLTTQLRAAVFEETQPAGHTGGARGARGLLGYAYLLEGDWRAAAAWAEDTRVQAGLGNDDLLRTVSAGLVRMGLAAGPEPADDVLAQELSGAPQIIRVHGDQLETVTRTLPANELLDAAVQLYERLVERSAHGGNRGTYARAGACCRVIRSIRRLQDRPAAFEHYYRGLFVTYRRYPALKDEIRKAIEGSRDRRSM